MIFVPAGGLVGMTWMARLTVLNAQPGAAMAPDMPLPLAVVSLPFTGSTKYWLPLTLLHCVQVWLLQAKPSPNIGLTAQSLSEQQFPGVQVLPQQKSPVFAVHALLLVVHAAVTHLPWLVPDAVLQILSVP